MPAHAAKIVAVPAGISPRRQFSKLEKTVDHFVQSAVASHGEKVARPFAREFVREMDRLFFALGFEDTEFRFERNEFFVHLVKGAAHFSAVRYGVQYDIQHLSEPSQR